jgi:hypothetical protein
VYNSYWGQRWYKTSRWWLGTEVVQDIPLVVVEIPAEEEEDKTD